MILSLFFISAQSWSLVTKFEQNKLSNGQLTRNKKGYVEKNVSFQTVCYFSHSSFTLVGWGTFLLACFGYFELWAVKPSFIVYFYLFIYSTSVRLLNSNTCFLKFKYLYSHSFNSIKKTLKEYARVDSSFCYPLITSSW